MKEKCLLCGEPKKKFCTRCGRGVPIDESKLSPEWRARLKHAREMERKSTIALFVAVIALIFS